MIITSVPELCVRTGYPCPHCPHWPLTGVPARVTEASKEVQFSLVWPSATTNVLNILTLLFSFPCCNICNFLHMFTTPSSY